MRLSRCFIVRTPRARLGGGRRVQRTFDRETHGGGADLELLGDVEAALAALKRSAVLDATQTVEAMELMMAATNAKIAEVRAEL